MNDSQHGAVEEVVFALSDPNYPFVGVSEAEQCQVELEKMIPHEDEQYAEFFSVIGADPDHVLALAKEHPHVEPAVLDRREGGGLFEFVVSGGCPARHLATLGALPQVVESTDGKGRIAAEVLPGYDTSDVVDEFLEDHVSAELVAKREKAQPTPLFTGRELQRTIDEQMTDRQREVLRAAYETGYYERPRETTGEEVADELGITGATFSQHIRAAERNLIAVLYEEDTI